MTSRPPAKHSLYLRGHRTSVSLEPEFWSAFRAIAAENGLALNALAARVDAARAPDVGLASALRVFVLSHYRRLAEDAPGGSSVTENGVAPAPTPAPAPAQTPAAGSGSDTHQPAPGGDGASGGRRPQDR